MAPQHSLGKTNDAGSKEIEDSEDLLEQAETYANAPFIGLDHDLQSWNPPHWDDVVVLPLDPAIEEILPCMDCGQVSTHSNECNLSSIRLRPAEDLNILETHDIADAVHRFDPENWRLSMGRPPTPEPEPFESKVKGMAETVRGLDEYKNDPDLHGLDDEDLLWLFVFKSISVRSEVIWRNWSQD
ncbi:hypothetical protein EJ04DRAFT_573730 [Polyplosphaeria fusca]|uniref:Uncharacterized protein n=1 Tax=Polyplosphaeria fusca TaxID=682080 RepID=A0A9P4V6J5_9PLEO|nr:hypothetical protein EJ04DRAFT_573730 [Polyplosphaeria fusca]